MIPLLEAECAKEAQARSVTLPPDWSALAVVDKLREAMTDVQPAVLKAVAKLRDDGTCCPYPPPGGSQLLWLLVGTVKTRSTSNPEYLHTSPINTIYIIWFILKTGSGLKGSKLCSQAF